MLSFAHFNVPTLLNTLLCLTVAFICGSLIGFERQFRQRTAGLRTNALVAVAAAIFVDMAGQLSGPDGAVRVVAYVVSGVGFLGAGTIMKDGMNVRGLNTAATLWGSAAVGACAGAGLLSQAVLATVFVLAANTLLRPIVNAVNRAPLDEAASELSFTLCVVAGRDKQKAAMELIDQLLEQGQHPISELDVEPFGEDEVEIKATLTATSVESEELDAVITALVAKQWISQAYWNTGVNE
ncbi:MgtC/SapB family protein [uncultured Aquitalea sp.]|uniref:MgtC/SapB family protein n=1 Tax=uncultured Aquitalea sp. TaxID=540272 RepID=UPI0025DAE824|nr:MgtC/SapB family protein [uncultured Aquitalea sp.]